MVYGTHKGQPTLTWLNSMVVIIAGTLRQQDLARNAKVFCGKGIWILSTVKLIAGLKFNEDGCSG